MIGVDFAPLIESKVTQGEFAKLLRVSRVTVSGWINGKMGVHAMRKPRIVRLLGVLAQATQDGLLPLRDVPRDKRFDAIKKVVVSYLRSAD